MLLPVRLNDTVHYSAIRDSFRITFKFVGFLHRRFIVYMHFDSPRLNLS
jgi:hypothetical protein